MSTNDSANALLTFKVGPFRLGVPAITVEAIINMPAFRSVPLSGPSVAGVFAYRDQVAVIISLRRKFGLPQAADPATGQLMLARLNTGLTAFWVDEVLDMTPVAETDVRPLNTFTRDNTFNNFVLNDEQIFLRTDFEALYALAEPADEPAPVAPPPRGSEVATIPTVGQGCGPDLQQAEQPVPRDAAADKQPAKAAAHTAVPPSTQVDRLARAPAGRTASAGPSTPPPEQRAVQKPPAKPLGAPRIRLRDTSSGAVSHPVRPPRAGSLPTASPPSKNRPVLVLLIGIAVTLGGLCGYALWPEAPSDSTTVLPAQTQPDDNQKAESDTLPTGQPDPVENNKEVPPVAPAAGPAADSTAVPLKEVTVAAAPPQPATPAASAKPQALEAPAATPDRSAPAPADPIVWRVETDDFILTVERPQPGAPDVPPAPSAPAGSHERVHVVVPGDTLWHIARRYLGDPFRYAELAELSRIKNPDLIYPGDIVRIQKKNVASP